MSRLLARPRWRPFVRPLLLVGLLLPTLTGLIACGDAPAPEQPLQPDEAQAPEGGAASRHAASAAGKEAPTAVEAPATEPDDPSAVEIQCDGTIVRRVGKRDLASALSLKDALPKSAQDPAGWDSVILKSREGGMVRLMDAPRDLAGKQIFLYLERDGEPALGIFERPAAPGPGSKARPTQFVIRAEQVILWTQARAAAPGEPRESTLTVRVVGGGAPVELTREELGELPEHEAPTAPGGGGGGKNRSGEHMPGWHVLDIVALALDDVDDVASVRLLGNTAPLTLDVALLKHKGAKPIVRFNRRGTIAFDLAGTGPDGKQVSGRARGVTTLEVTRKKAADTDAKKDAKKDGKKDAK